ncbi:glycosyltransferase family protein [Shewanella indica]|uniref:hypothetical protein n=1 Tax=Shewanella indica TaxID=768528 RepID=UPI001CFDAAB2|nr:hypothetical protein [Shewanella indica]
MKKIKILFYVEHISREMGVIEEVIKECNLSKDEYAICSTDFFMGISKFIYSPDVVVTPWMYSDFCYKKLLSFPFKDKIKHLNLHHEQITNQDRLDALIPSGKAKLGQHISWGREFYNNLRNVGVPEKDIFITGSMRLKKGNVKSSKKTLSESFLGDSQLAHKTWVLFISSYSWKNMDDKMVAKVENNGRKNVWEYRDLVLSSYKLTLNWIEEFLKVNPDKVYIYRLHPSEEKDELLVSMLNRYDNFKVISELPVSEWIYNADLIDLWISTSLAEVLIMEKPIRVIRPLELPENVEIIGFENLDKVIELSDFINIDLEKGYNKNTGFDYMDRYYSNNLNSALETKKAIQKILNMPAYKIDMTKSSRVYYSGLEAVKDCVKIILYKSGLIRFTRLNRSVKSFFTVRKNEI